MADRTRYLTVSQMARHSGVSIRALHHYDDIGLLVADRSTSGYRLYGPNHVTRLQDILLRRSMGRSLEDIRAELDDPSYDLVTSLRKHRENLTQTLRETKAMIRGIDTTLSALTSSTEDIMTRDTLFDGFDPSQFEEEARTRWGDTDTWKQARRNTAVYGEAEWKAIKAESDAIFANAAQAAASGTAPDSDLGAELIDRHRAHLERWFYEVSPALHLGLAEMWQADPRFRDTMDSFGPGTTDWLSKAIRCAYC